MDPLIEAQSDQRRRLTAAFLGRPAPPQTVRPVLVGALIAAGIAAAHVIGSLW